MWGTVSYMPTVGVIDVGSSTIRLVVCRYDAQRDTFVQLCKRGAHLGLGAEVERHGEYRRTVLARVEARLRKLAARAARIDCDRFAVVVTAPGRNGNNADELLQVVGEATETEPWLLAPAEEARLAFAGATMGAPPGDDAWVCDVGGGSTEVAFGSPGSAVMTSTSFDVGAFALAERHFRHDPPRASELFAARAAAERAVTLDLDEPAGLALAAGGSARAVARLAGSVVSEDELAEALEASLSKKPVVKNPLRRRSLPAGIVILDVLHSTLGLPLTIAPGGLREGVLLHLARAA